MFAIWFVSRVLTPTLLTLLRMISNTVRAYHPVELQDPMVAFSIFSGITLTHASQFQSVDEG